MLLEKQLLMRTPSSASPACVALGDSVATEVHMAATTCAKCGTVCERDEIGLCVPCRVEAHTEPQYEFVKGANGVVLAIPVRPVPRIGAAMAVSGAASRDGDNK